MTAGYGLTFHAICRRVSSGEVKYVIISKSLYRCCKSRICREPIGSPLCKNFDLHSKKSGSSKSCRKEVSFGLLQLYLPLIQHSCICIIIIILIIHHVTCPCQLSVDAALVPHVDTSLPDT